MIYIVKILYYITQIGHNDIDYYLISTVQRYMSDKSLLSEFKKVVFKITLVLVLDVFELKVREVWVRGRLYELMLKKVKSAL